MLDRKGKALAVASTSSMDKCLNAVSARMDSTFWANQDKYGRCL